MALVDLRISIRTSPLYSVCSLLAIKTTEVQPAVIRNSPGKSYFHTKRSSKSHIERKRLVMMAIKALAERSVMSAYGVIASVMINPDIIRTKPSHHLVE